MAAWSSREHDKQMAASLRMIASAMGGTGISSQTLDEMKRTVAKADCDASNVVEVLERMAEDSDEEEHLGPLHDAAGAGKMDVCKHLVENLGFDVDVRANDGSGKTPLTCAVSRGKVIAVRYLIAKGADLNKQDAMGFTPLHYAVKKGYSGIARLLLSRGANVDVESSEGTPLHVSAARGKFGVMEILLEHHADPDRVSPDLCTPLAIILCATYEKASLSACLKCMKLLVKAGADLNSTNPDTPLVIATSRGLNECIDYLLEVGANANIQIKHGHKTPIEIAAKSGRRNLVESLFPFTSPIQTISDWSVEGILAHARSRQSKHKGERSDNDSKIQLNLNGERSVKEDAGALKGCTEDKLSDEDRKAQLKLHGGQAVKGKDYAGASKFYTEAIMLDPADATLYSNRSFCHLKIGGARDALVDANACISLQPDWPKGYYRKGSALMSLKEYKEARDAFMDGLRLDPSNLDIQNAYWEADEAMIKKHSTGQSAD
ncbi:hypothetical protein BDA96_01G143900 [Sorghum bicolor]|uniref:Uncharacterized protein n=2 Tax=Sorghum bicolor TaxID=4558 RepID=A0A921RZ01_SORBI|nr:ankyrin-3 [Sorghum bicolor]EER91080.2 hypothetical protein SORBI_3001G137800 [Sorghum bicolor]KAG0548175.1 hypothetical protein BDA96_01G143900 [Sorghum bicolor]|eukprot:XP_021316867.1 ankyrin-3 [Sorghum bicolor]